VRSPNVHKYSTYGRKSNPLARRFTLKFRTEAKAEAITIIGLPFAKQHIKLIPSRSCPSDTTCASKTRRPFRHIAITA
jgi:uncharacterized membrane protein YccF (DUF307 family)